MKRFFALIFLSGLLLTSCGGPSYSVAEPEVLKEYPELVGAINTWQAMVDAADSEDCTAFLDAMRISLKLTDEVCPAAFEYLNDVPQVDWSRTEWSSTGGKAKIYKFEGGSITSFIHNEADDSWRSDTIFWE